MLAAVMAGGAVGVAFRELALLPATAIEEPSAVTLATLVINVAGSFLLGVVVVTLGDRHPVWRGFVGTGMLGGFTTYSAFAVQSAVAVSTAPVLAAALALVAVSLGLVAAFAGIWAARGIRRAFGRAV
nr:CrcB family protein [Microbacterium aquimaris]